MTMVADWLRGLGSGSWLVARAARGAGLDAMARDGFARRRAAEALAIFFWGPLPVLTALAALVGVVAGTIAARALGVYDVELVVEPLLTRTLCRDVMPILIGLLAVGRIAVELAARLAGASLSREVDALEALGHDPVRHFLSPALVATLVAVPLHMVIACATALVVTGLVVCRSAATSWFTYVGLIDRSVAQALVIGTAKALLFALIAFAVGAAVGARGARDPADVGRRATRAFTAGILAVFAAAALLVALA